jgi:hypothetical protein
MISVGVAPTPLISVGVAPTPLIGGAQRLDNWRAAPKQAARSAWITGARRLTN